MCIRDSSVTPVSVHCITSHVEGGIVIRLLATRLTLSAPPNYYSYSCLTEAARVLCAELGFSMRARSLSFFTFHVSPSSLLDNGGIAIVRRLNFSSHRGLLLYRKSWRMFFSTGDSSYWSVLYRSTYILYDFLIFYLVWLHTCAICLEFLHIVLVFATLLGSALFCFITRSWMLSCIYTQSYLVVLFVDCVLRFLHNLQWCPFIYLVFMCTHCWVCF